MTLAIAIAAACLWLLTFLWAFCALRLRAEVAGGRWSVVGEGGELQGTGDRGEPLPGTAPPPATGHRPLTAVLLPARDEAGRLLEESVRSLLRQEYPRLEIIAIDDRSTDGTGEILRRLATGEDAAGRMTVLTGTEPPPGWVGKQNALTQAAAQARGDWLLFVDADAVYDSRIVGEAVDRAEALGLDALSLLPRFDVGSFGVSITYPVGFAALLLAAPPSRVNRTGTRTALAWGGFFLIRRSVFEAIGGFREVCAETSEDTKLAALLKRDGYRLSVALCPDRLFTPMYPSLAALWRGTMKNVYAGPVATPLIALLLLAAGVLPAVVAAASVVTGLWTLALPGALCWGAQAAVLVPVYRLNRIGAWRAAFFPVGVAIAAAQMLAVTWRVAVTGQGITWRGRRLRSRRQRTDEATAAARKDGSRPPLSAPSEQRPQSPR